MTQTKALKLSTRNGSPLPAPVETFRRQGGVCATYLAGGQGTGPLYLFLGDISLEANWSQLFRLIGSHRGARGRGGARLRSARFVAFPGKSRKGVWRQLVITDASGPAILSSYRFRSVGGGANFPAPLQIKPFGGRAATLSNSNLASYFVKRKSSACRTRTSVLGLPERRFGCSAWPRGEPEALSRRPPPIN